MAVFGAGRSELLSRKYLMLFNLAIVYENIALWAFTHVSDAIGLVQIYLVGGEVVSAVAASLGFSFRLHII